MRVVSGLVAIAFLCFASPVFAQQIEGITNFANCKDDSLDRVMKNGITLGISPSPPYSSLDPNTKKAEGLDVDIHQTPDRLKVVTFTTPAWWYGPAIVAQKGNPTGIKSFDDLKGKKVGAIA